MRARLRDRRARSSTSRERDEIAANRSITTPIALLGFLIVAISIAGLANAITTSVLERTREIGILRTIGARARDVRRIFTDRKHRDRPWRLATRDPARLPARRPPRLAGLGSRRRHRSRRCSRPGTSLLALVGTVVLAVLSTLLPIRRVVRYRPGEALRYS